MIKIEEVEKVYSGKPGCACGCRGKYWESGPMVKRIVKMFNEFPAGATQDLKGNWAELTNDASPSQRVYVIYFKKGAI